MAADPRSTFFAEAALHTVGGSGDAAELVSDGAMQRFLEDAACPLLVASVGAVRPRLPPSPQNRARSFFSPVHHCAMR